MSNRIFQTASIAKLSLFLSSVFLIGCTVAAKTEEKSSIEKGEKTSPQSERAAIISRSKNSLTVSKIKFAPNSPADTIRVFYKNLREKHFREAMLMTNLRAGVEGLTDAEMEDLRPDFEPLAAQVPAEIEINGEIVTNNLATVTAKMPNEETGAPELKEFKLRRENDSWVILTADEAAENAAKKAGKNYFFALRLDVHHTEAQSMMERIAKAEMIYALQNQGSYAELPVLVSQGLLPADAQNAASTGYRYNVALAPDAKKYSASAEPAVYGKTGKLSFLMEADGKNSAPRLRNGDNKGQPLKK